MRISAAAWSRATARWGGCSTVTVSPQLSSISVAGLAAVAVGETGALVDGTDAAAEVATALVVVLVADPCAEQPVTARTAVVTPVIRMALVCIWRTLAAGFEARSTPSDRKDRRAIDA